jgi:subtilisin family serine protease/peptidoglycan hydrolase-like protein with peptidoglycan-binding domain
MMNQKNIAIVLVLLVSLVLLYVVFTAPEPPPPPPPDTDGDGIADDVDNCPAVSNPDQSDIDGDGLGDACDDDIDGDNVSNSDDNCPVDYNPEQFDMDDDNKGDACDFNMVTKYGIFDPVNEENPVPEELRTENESGYYVIQFFDDFNQSEATGLLDSGEFIDALPTDAIVFKTHLTLEQIKAYQFVRYAETYHPAYKLSITYSELYQKGELTDTYDIWVHSFVDVESILDDLQSFGSPQKIDSNIVEMYNVSGEDIIEIAMLPEVELIEPLPVSDVFNNVAQRIIHISNANDGVRTVHNLTGNGQIVAVADTGLDNGNFLNIDLDFRGRVAGAMSSYTINPSREDDTSVTWSDGDGHGTHVAGTVLGSGANNVLYTGAAPKAKLFVMAIGNATGNLTGIPSNIERLFDLAYNSSHDVRIHTNSWGGGSGYQSRTKAIDDYIRKRDNMFILFAASNDGPEEETLSREANSKNALVVGASENVRLLPAGGQYSRGNCKNLTRPVESDDQDDVACFSSRGPASGSRIKPDLVAPGTYIASPSSSAVPGPAPGDYIYKSGTSMATPLVAGAAALTREYLAKYMNNTDPDSALIKAILIQGAQDMPSTGHGNSTTGSIPNSDEGFGRLNLTKALFPLGTHNTVIFDEADRFTDDEDEDFIFYEIRTTQMQPLEITLVWNDDDGSIISSSLVNDLDLKAESPSGKIYKGNVMTNGVSTPNPSSSSKDSKNNVEKIIINDTEDGFYNITVRSYNLHPFTEGQDYDIVISPAIGIDAAKDNEAYYDFTNENVNVITEGLKKEEKVALYIINYTGRKWQDGINLSGHDVSGYTEEFTASKVGVINDSSIWKGASNWIYYGGGDGRYNIVADRNKNGTFELDEDLVDYYNESGFTVQAISSCDLNDTVKKTFTSSDDYVHVMGGGFNNSIDVDIYLTPDIRIGYAPFYKVRTVTTSSNGTFFPRRIMSSPSNYIYTKSLENVFTIMADTLRDGSPFDPENDSRDQVDIGYTGDILSNNPFVLRSGDTGNAVSQLQAFLNSQSFKVNVTGNFTNATASALMEYEESRHLLVDGVLHNVEMPILLSDAVRSFRVHAAAATDNSDVIQRVYQPYETVYAKGGVYSPSNVLDVYVIKHNASLKNGGRLSDVSVDAFNAVTADAKGTFSTLLLWANLSSANAGYYDIVVDVDQDGFFNKSVDTKDQINFYDVDDAATTGERVSLGSAGDEALEIETFLKTFWDRSVSADAIIDTNEVALWQQYQRSRGLTVTDTIDQATLNQMKAEASISFRVQAVESSDKNGTIKNVFIPTEEPGLVDVIVCTDEDKPSPDPKVAAVLDEPEDNESVYAFGKGFIPNKPSSLYIVNSSTWRDGMQLHDESGAAEHVIISSDGELNTTMVWGNIRRENAGLYDIIVDVDNDGYFNDSHKSRDAADQRVKWGVAIPRVDSSDAAEEETDLFVGPGKIYAKGVGFVPGEDVAVFVTDNNYSWKDGSNLSDVTEQVENVKIDQDGKFFVSVWDEPETGSYDIVVDRDKNGIYNRSIDVIDMGKALGFEVRSNWTVMVYMAAEKDLKPEALEDINEMEKIGSTVNSTVVVQVDLAAATGTSVRGELNSSPTRLLIDKDNDTNKINSTKMMVLPEISMGSSTALTGFVQWAARCFPAENYVLVLWGNGDGWKSNPALPSGLLTDTEPGNDAMQMSELKGATDAIPKALNKTKLDILAFDAPLMATVEVATQVKNGTSIMVASQGTKIQTGSEPPSKKNTINWDYEDLIKRLNKDPKQSPTDYAKEMVKHASGAGVDTMSAINLMGIDGLNSEIDGLASPTDLRGRMIPSTPPTECPPYTLPTSTGLFDFANIKDNTDNVQKGVLDSRVATQAFGGIIGYDVKKYSYDLDETPDGKAIAAARGGNDPVWGDMDFIDIKDFAQKIQQNGLVKNKAHAGPIITLLAKGGPVIIEEYHGGGFPNANGLSIYYPFQQKRQGEDPIKEFSYDGPQPLSDNIYHGSGLEFTNDVAWWKDDDDVMDGRFLKRYYTPVSDAVIVTDEGDVKVYEVTVPSCGEEDTPDSNPGAIEVEVTFSGEGSSGSDFEGFATFGVKKQSRYSWDFGDDESCMEIWNDKPKIGNNDGIPAEGEITANTCDKVFDGIAQHTYDECGCYVVTLTTTDDDGKSHVDWAFVDIKNATNVSCGDGVINQPWEQCETGVACLGNLTCVMPGCQCVGISLKNVSCTDNTEREGHIVVTGGYDPRYDICTDDCQRLGSGYECNPSTCVCEKKTGMSCADNTPDDDTWPRSTFDPSKHICIDDCPEDLDCDFSDCRCKSSTSPPQTCSANTLVINVPKGNPPPICIDDCTAVYGERAKCDPEGCFCTKLITPRCGDGVVSGPNAPGGGMEECDVGNGSIDTCPTPKVCNPETCKCEEPAVEGACGDGIINLGEDCDYASADTNKCPETANDLPDYCTASCMCTQIEHTPVCGDGKITGTEGCDGGHVNTNICPSGYTCYTPECTCIVEEGTDQCGDGTVTAPEECDHGNSYTDDCPGGKTCYSCQCLDPGEVPDEPYCGNNEREGSEECDGTDDSACSANEYCSSCQCVEEVDEGYCGDGDVAYPEQCESDSDCDGEEVCSGCQCVEYTVYYCGDGQVTGNEECESDAECDGICYNCQCLSPPSVNCGSWCADQGYSSSLGSSYGSGAACSAAAAEDQVMCMVKCIYVQFGSWSNPAGTTTCCCKEVYTEECPATQGGGCDCPDEEYVDEVLCPSHAP